MSRSQVPSLPPALARVIAVLLLCCGQLFPQPASGKTVASPQATAAEFYRWYMTSLYANRVPLVEQPGELSSYVTEGLIREIRRRTKRNGLHADYFIQAQDFLEDWASDITVGRPAIRGDRAGVVVVLGASPETRRRLTLTMVRDAAGWKISTVRL